MSETNSNARHFYTAWRNISHMAKESYRDYIVAKDIAGMIAKPKVPDFPGSKDVLKVQTEMRVYNLLQGRVRFYKERWIRLNVAAMAAFDSYVEHLKKEDK